MTLGSESERRNFMSHMQQCETPQEWLEDLFQYGYREECGGSCRD